MTIFSYKITYDTGAAPCIQNNLCSLTICKPRIRKCAKIGDYIIGFNASSVSQNNSISYIAKITDKKTFKEYYKTHSERTDCIYDDQLNLLKNPFHKSCHKECDLKGEYILLSNDFIFFGDKNIQISEPFKSMIPNRGHFSKKNQPYEPKIPYYFERLKEEHGTGKQGNHIHSTIPSHSCKH